MNVGILGWSRVPKISLTRFNFYQLFENKYDNLFTMVHYPLSLSLHISCIKFTIIRSRHLLLRLSISAPTKKKKKTKQKLWIFFLLFNYRKRGWGTDLFKKCKYKFACRCTWIRAFLSSYCDNILALFMIIRV